MGRGSVGDGAKERPRKRVNPGPKTRLKSRRHVSAVLLAAGASNRFGGGKQLASLDDHTTLAGRALETLRHSTVDSIFLVLGHRSHDVLKSLGPLERRIVVVTNSRFSEGLSSSLKVGVRAAAPRSDAVVVALADQPFVTPELIDDIIDRHRKTGRAVASVTPDGLITPPMLLDKALFGEVMELQGDLGAKSVVLRHEPFERVDVEPDALMDVDTPTDLEVARERWNLSSGARALRARRDLGAGSRARAPPS